MKKAFHNTFCVLMALLLLASTVSWTVGKHYCMGRLMNVALFSHAEDCGMDMEGMISTSFSDEKKSCCNDEMIVIDGQDDLKLTFSDLNVDQQHFLVILADSYLNLTIRFTDRLIPNSVYPPPLLVKDIQLLDDVFLI